MHLKLRLFTLTTLTALLLGACAVFSETTEQFHKTFTLREGIPVQVENISGKVDISVWDQQTVDVQAVKRAHGNPRDLERASIDIDTTGKLLIKTRYQRKDRESSFFGLFSGGGSGPNVSVDYTIKLPRAAVLREVSTVSADIIVRGVRGEPRLHSVSGDISVSGAAGPVALESTSGDVEMTGGTVKRAETVSGELQLRNISGDLDVNTTSGGITVVGTGGRIDVHSVSGDIRITGMQVGNIETVSGDINVSPSRLGNSTVFSTVSGDIRLRVPGDIDADVNMDTVSGTLRVEGGLEMKVTQTSRKHISGRIGSGGRTLAVNTTSGDVLLEK